MYKYYKVLDLAKCFILPRNVEVALGVDAEPVGEQKYNIIKMHDC